MDTKNIAFISIVAGGSVLILFLWLPTFAENIQSMTQSMNLSSSKTIQTIKKQSNELFQNTREELTENIKKLEQEKQKQDALRTTMIDILKENIRLQQQASLKNVSTSETITPTTSIVSQTPSSSLPIIP